NETAARTFWGGAEEALGGRLRPQSAPDDWVPVIGVVADALVGPPGTPPLPMIFYPLAEGATDRPFVVLRAAVEPASLLPAMRAAVRELDPRLPMNRLDTMAGHMSAALAGPKLAAGVLGLFSALALLLASIGIYTI